MSKISEEDKKTIIPYEKATITDLAREVSILKVKINELDEGITYLYKALKEAMEAEHKKLIEIDENVKRLKSILNDFKFSIKKRLIVLTVLMIISICLIVLL